MTSVVPFAVLPAGVSVLHVGRYWLVMLQSLRPFSVVCHTRFASTALLCTTTSDRASNIATHCLGFGLLNRSSMPQKVTARCLVAHFFCYLQTDKAKPHSDFCFVALFVCSTCAHVSVSARVCLCARACSVRASILSVFFFRKAPCLIARGVACSISRPPPLPPPPDPQKFSHPVGV